jgi:hypothetical protein
MPKRRGDFRRNLTSAGGRAAAACVLLPALAAWACSGGKDVPPSNDDPTAGAAGSSGTSAAGSAGTQATGGSGVGGSTGGGSGVGGSGVGGSTGGSAAGSTAAGEGGSTDGGTGGWTAGTGAVAAGEGGSASSTGGSGGTTTTPPGEDSELETASGCAGVFNPEQVLEYRLEIAPADWEAMLADTTSTLPYVEAQFSCGDEPPITVGIQRKRSGGAQRIGLKIDLNDRVADQTFYDLKKLSFENGVSSGSTSDDATARDVLAEYLGFRVMQRTSVISSRVAFASVSVNGGPAMAYVNVERIDKRFLSVRLGEDGGWLYKKSGGEGDGLKTHESDGVANPYEQDFCFWLRGTGCSVPSAAELLETLPRILDIPQMLRVGAINALIANTDTILFKDNNYYYYDRVGGGRVYFPWDLDTAFASDLDAVSGSVPGGTTQFTDVLFSNWRADYVAILQQAVSTDAKLEVVAAELDRAVSVGGPAIDADPYLTGTTAEAAQALKEFWEGRLASVQATLSSL